MDCRHVEPQLEAYALGILEQPEAETVRQHLAGCARCRALVDDYAAVLHTLPQALDAAAPQPIPERLKNRLFETLDDPAEPHRPAPAEAGQPDRAAVLPARSRWGRWRAATALLAAVLLLVLLGWTIHLNVVLAEERALRAEIAKLVGQQELVLEVIDSDQTSRAVLRSPQPDSRAYGKLFTRADLPHVVAMAARLPQPPPGQAYRLWVTGADGQVSPAGSMTINEQGFGLIVFDADQAGPAYQKAELRLQDAAAPSPSGDLVLQWTAAP